MFSFWWLFKSTTELMIKDGGCANATDFLKKEHVGMLDFLHQLFMLSLMIYCFQNKMVVK